MEEVIVFNEVNGNEVSLLFDGCDYEVRLNNDFILTTGDEAEAHIVAESLDIALSILDNQKILKNRNDLGR